MTVSEMAKAHDLDAGALACMLEFLADNIRKNATALGVLQAGGPAADALLKAGVRAWYSHSQNMLRELAEGRTEWALAVREKLASDVYHQLRGEAA